MMIMPINQFKNIDTKEKAYWLGFLFADGCVVNYKYTKKIVLISNRKDENDVIDKFIGFMKIDNKKYYRANGTMEISFRNVEIGDNLIQHGCIPRKSKVIELPDLDSRELYLAFLLGFFDGDGTQGTTRITCGSRKFLEQIKEMFQLQFKILDKHSDGYIEGRKIRGNGYSLCLGANLFNEMMSNYSNSLPRKRHYFGSNDERIEKIKQSSWKGHHEKKFSISKEDLSRIVWEMPSERIAEKYGVSGSTIAKRCKQLGIKKPGRGYWQSILVKS